MKPAVRPRRPHFSSGPCPKPPGWTPGWLSRALVGRSHRAADAREKLRMVIERSRSLLGIPGSHRIAILPGSDTGAVESALWNLLGARGVDVLAFDQFGHEWARDVLRELRIGDARVLPAPFGEIPDLSRWDPARDLVFTWTGTSAGTCVPGGDWIPADREGLAICDATAAVFAVELPWDRLDVATYSWQKAMGGEAQHGMLVLGPRAWARLESYRPPWPVPKVFRLTREGKPDAALFAGEVINTPSLLAVEDALRSLDWIESAGGLAGMIARAAANRAVLDAWIADAGWVAHLARDPAIRAPTPVCMRLAGPEFEALPEAERRRAADAIAALLADEGVAFDIGAYRTAPPGLRVWTGGTVERADIEALPPWLDWAHAEAMRQRRRTDRG